jgi:hypothetical protein
VANPWWADDDELLAVLKGALTAAEAVPRSFIEAGRAAYTWRTIDAELAVLTYDSAGDAGLLAGATRADSAALRALTFASNRLTIEVELTPDGLLGQITPPQAGSVTAKAGELDVATAVIDDLGFFALHPLPTRPFRLLVDMPSGETAVTGWISP